MYALDITDSTHACTQQRSAKGREPQKLDRGEGTRQAGRGSGAAVSLEAVHHHRHHAPGNTLRKPFVQIQEQGQESRRPLSPHNHPHRSQISVNQEYRRAPEERAMSASVTQDLAQQLERLAALHGTGSLTQAEFGTAKQVNEECSRIMHSAILCKTSCCIIFHFLGTRRNPDFVIIIHTHPHSCKCYVHMETRSPQKSRALMLKIQKETATKRMCGTSIHLCKMNSTGAPDAKHSHTCIHEQYS